jgi:hypothetical protein
VTGVPQSEVFPRLTLASRRVMMRTGPGSGIRQVPGEAVSTGGVMCAQRGSPIAADGNGGAPLTYERVGAAAVIEIRRPQRRGAP